MSFAFLAMDFNLGFVKPMLTFFFLLKFCTAIDTITPTRSMTDAETIVSVSEKFTLGFFSPNNSTNRYVGIWYSNVRIQPQTVVWVANREKPVNDSSGILKISSDGNLVLIDGRGRILWSTNLPNSTINSSAKILDSGNFILTDLNYYSKGGALLWQSFDYPTDTLLPGMKLGLNLKTGLNWSLSSWKSQNNPGRGEFSYILDPQGKPQLFLMKGFDRLYRTGPWNGLRLSGTPQITPTYVLNFSFISNNEEMYIMYTVKNSSVISRYKIDDSGHGQRFMWSDNTHEWNIPWTVPGDACDNYRRCGVYSSCRASEDWECACLYGFEPKSPQDWSLRDASDGCMRKKQLDCGNMDGFYRLERTKVPDTRSCRVDLNSNLEECRKQCLNNCSCTAYACADIRGGGSGCLNWYGELVDMKVFPDFGQDIYIRVAASELGSNGSKKGILISVLTVILGMLVLVSFGYFFWRRKTKGQAEMERCDGIVSNMGRRDVGEEDSFRNELQESSRRAEFLLFDLDTVVTATNYFSSENKLGEGGFGPVYKGMLANGEEIAVKRLSKSSGQGREEFKNEVMSIAKLQHRNLVRLRGCCIQGEERMLIYEYMPNKSLDSFIFDRSRRVLLDWRKRFDIIIGVARGILYLHQDSLLRIIHRDLKSSNILLDTEMNPKISDFGMARIFRGNQTQANTNRVVGTHGYMAPEYAMDGDYSMKSDVFSFGVILLEIVSGRKNSGYYQNDPTLNLIGHAWNMWKEGRGLEILDSFLNNSCPESEVLRCIQVGLLCVQESAADRPNMSSVVFLLSNETTMPPPKQPVFYMKKKTDNPNSSTSGTGSQSINEVTISTIQGR